MGERKVVFFLAAFLAGLGLKGSSLWYLKSVWCFSSFYKIVQGGEGGGLCRYVAIRFSVG